MGCGSENGVDTEGCLNLAEWQSRLKMLDGLLQSFKFLPDPAKNTLNAGMQEKTECRKNEKICS